MAEKVVHPLDIDRYLGKAYNRVKRLGVELEGGWLTNVPSTLSPGYKYEGDGSVFSGGTIQSHPKYSQIKVKGEVSTPPIRPAQLPLSLKKVYPELVDNTCGMHVHMSFETSAQYAILADSPVYQETVLHYLLKWAATEGFSESHHIWDRLKGKHKYCLKKFWPYAQMTKKSKDYTHEGDHRYTAISYQWERYKTIECRVLPMMETVPQAVRAIQQLLKITNAYLVVVAKPKVGLKKIISLSDVDSYNEKIEVRF